MRQRRRKRSSTIVGGVELRPWSELPDLILVRILNCLFSAADIIALSAVCRCWRSVSLSALRDGAVTSPPPLLFLPLLRRCSPHHRVNRWGVRKSSRHLFCLLSLADRYRRWCYCPPVPRCANHLPSSLLGYSHGFVIISKSPNAIQLINLFSSEELRPPDVNAKGDLHYGIFTEPPGSSSCRLLLFGGGFCLAWRPGDECWFHSYLRSLPCVEHATVFKGKVYAVDHDARLITVESFNPFAVKKLEVIPSIRDLPQPLSFGFLGRFCIRWLVECQDDLLMLWLGQEDDVLTTKIHVYRLDFAGPQLGWVKVDNIGDCCLFIDIWGKSPVAYAKPDRWGGRSNCVYFARHTCGWSMFPLDGEPIELARDSPISSENICARVFPSIWVMPF